MITRILNWINTVFNGKSNAKNADTTFSLGEKVTPDTVTPHDQNNSNHLEVDHTIDSSIICREIILNKNQKVAGYFFNLSPNVLSRLDSASHLTRSLYDDVLIEHIVRMNVSRLRGQRMVFVPVLPFSLERASIEKLIGGDVVLVIGAIDELVGRAEQYLSRIKSLKQQGYKIALRGKHVMHPSLKVILDECELVYIDIEESDIPTIKSKIDVISQQYKAAKIIAANVRLMDEFRACGKLAMQYFQGDFVTHREQWGTPMIDTARIKILSLLNLLRQDADNAELLKIFKQDPTLSFKLLRSVNSVGAGYSIKINSIEQALIVIGRQQLYRWLCLLLFTSASQNPLDIVLMETALTRARLSELIAVKFLTKLESEEVFLAGIFSLLDILFKIPLENLLKQVHLPASVVEAITQKTGKYAPYLELSMASEEGMTDKVALLADRVGLDLAQLDVLQAEAIVWAQTVND